MREGRKGQKSRGGGGRGRGKVGSSPLDSRTGSSRWVCGWVFFLNGCSMFITQEYLDRFAANVALRRPMTFMSVSPLTAHGIGCRGSQRSLAMGVVKPANDDEDFYAGVKAREVKGLFERHVTTMLRVP